MSARLSSPERGFTLIELLVVVLIIGILIAVAAPAFLNQTQKAQDSATQQYLTYAYKDAASAAVDTTGGKAQGDFVGGSYTAASLAAEIQSSDPELTVRATNAGESCPSVALDQPDKSIYVDSTATVGNNLAICADPDHRVWTLRVVNGKLVGFDHVYTGSGGPNPSGAPANDDFANATVLSGLSGSSGRAPTVDDTTATLEPGEPQPSAGSITDTVWYKWVAPADGDYYFDNAGSIDTNPSSDNLSSGFNPLPLDAVMAVYQQTGSGLAGLVELGSNDEDPTNVSTAPSGGWTSLVAVSGVHAGDVLYIQSGSYDYRDAGQPAGPLEFEWVKGEAPAPPTSLSVPLSSSGNLQSPQVGDTLTVSPTASGSSLSYSYQWQRSGDGFSYTAIAGETSDHYTLQAADQGYLVQVLVVVSNPYGSLQGATGVNFGPTSVPSFSGSYTVSGATGPAGSAEVGDHLQLVPQGSWANSPYTFAYDWQRCNGPTPQNNCSTVAGNPDPSAPSSDSYTVQAADQGHSIYVQVQGFNSAGGGGPQALRIYVDSSVSSLTVNYQPGDWVSLAQNASSAPEYPLWLSSGTIGYYNSDRGSTYSHGAGPALQSVDGSYIFNPPLPVPSFDYSAHYTSAWGVSPSGSLLAYSSASTVFVNSFVNNSVTTSFGGEPPVSGRSTLFFSPDGSKLAWLSGQDLIVVNSNGSGAMHNVTQCGNSGGHCISGINGNPPTLGNPWAPDSTHLYYPGEDGIYEVDLSSIDFSSVFNPLPTSTRIYSPPAGENVDATAVAPDGKVAFFQTLSGGVELARVNADGSSRISISSWPSQTSVLPPVWSPSSGKLAFGLPGSDTLYLWSGSGTPDALLTGFAGSTFQQVSFSPDSNWILYGGGDSQGQPTGISYLRRLS